MLSGAKDHDGMCIKPRFARERHINKHDITNRLFRNKKKKHPTFNLLHRFVGCFGNAVILYMYILSTITYMYIDFKKI